MKKKICTDFLFPRASFLTGVASSINVVGNFYHFNYSSSDDEADYKAIRCDWDMIGSDLMITSENETGKSLIKSIDREYAIN